MFNTDIMLFATVYKKSGTMRAHQIFVHLHIHQHPDIDLHVL